MTLSGILGLCLGISELLGLLFSKHGGILATTCTGLTKLFQLAMSAGGGV